MEPATPPAPEQDHPDDEQAFIEAHMQRAKAEEDVWKTASTEELFARMEAIQEQARRRAAAWAWQEEQQRRQQGQTTGTSTAAALPLAPSYRTTLDDLKDMLGQDSYPTWFQAAYADLAARLIRMEGQLEDQATTLSLLHGKVEEMLGYVISRETAAQDPTHEENQA